MPENISTSIPVTSIPVTPIPVTSIPVTSTSWQIGQSTEVPKIIINEVDTVGDRKPFIELKGAPGASLNGFTIVLFEAGDVTKRIDNKSYMAIPLDGYSIGASGYFVVGAKSVKNVDLVIMGQVNNSDPFFIMSDFGAIALYHGIVPYPTSGSGVAPSRENLVSAVTLKNGPKAIYSD